MRGWQWFICRTWYALFRSCERRRAGQGTRNGDGMRQHAGLRHRQGEWPLAPAGIAVVRLHGQAPDPCSTRLRGATRGKIVRTIFGDAKAPCPM
jgi:hypothetical protein